MTTVLIVGTTAEASDLSGMDITTEDLRDAIDAGDAEVADAGYDVVRGWIDEDRAGSVAAIREQLTAQRFDIVMIGNGVRGVPGLTELFEQIVNAVHELAPATRFAFNTDPASTLDALRRNS